MFFRSELLADLRENRKKAYYYIITQINKLNLYLDRNADSRTTDYNYISLNDLVELKEGLADPSKELVFSLKTLLKGSVSEAEIDEYLVKPFCDKT